MSTEPIPREYEIFYRDKERKEDVLSDTMSLPFQKVKQFGASKKDEWENKLIIGDNLQVTKYLLKLKKEGKLQNPDGSDGFKLICIDPPFATKQDFHGSTGEQAYSDKIIGSEYLEFIRKRLIILHELLTNDGAIYFHTDSRKSHYIKIIMDEIFGVNNFRNDIIWHYGQRTMHNKYKFNSKHDVLLFYVKSYKHTINQITMPWTKEEITKTRVRTIHKDEDGREYILDNRSVSKGIPVKKQYIDDIIKKGKAIDSVWDMPIISSTNSERIGYPTQKPEKLLARIMEASSNEGDLILDSFCGSGTVLAVAEKTNRRWIGIDSSKFSIYTCLKRMLNLKKEIGDSGMSLKAKPFGMYNAGLYVDGPYLKNLDEDEYRNFALELFQAQPANLVLNGFEMDGILMNSPVHIFPRGGSLTEEYIENLDKEVGQFLKERMFIIVPANRVYFLQDYIEIKGKRYYVLRIPYSIIDELHKKKFVRPWQPTSVDDMNQVIDSVGFDFIHPPEVETEFSKILSKDKDELEIKIKKFESVQRTKNPIEFKDKESLSMVLIDRFYNGDYFNMTNFFFADQIKNNKWKIKFPYEHQTEKMMIIYLDVLGNERVEVKDMKDFRRMK